MKTKKIYSLFSDVQKDDKTSWCIVFFQLNTYLVQVLVWSEKNCLIIGNYLAYWTINNAITISAQCLYIGIQVFFKDNITWKNILYNCNIFFLVQTWTKLYHDKHCWHLERPNIYWNWKKKLSMYWSCFSCILVKIVNWNRSEVNWISSLICRYVCSISRMQSKLWNVF